MLRWAGRAGLAASALLSGTSMAAGAAEVSFEPRLSGGVSYYELDIDGELALGDDTIDGIDFDDWLYFVGGGANISVDRFFIDVSGQYSFDGDEELNLDVQAGGIAINDLTQDVDFDRFEAAIALGYRITDHFSGYIGYRYANVDFDGSGAQGGVGVDLSADFEQHGPLIGASYIIPKTILNGVLVLNGAVTYLDGDLESEVSADVGLDDISANVDSDAVGFNGGISWATLINDRTKLVLGGDVSSYQFDENDEDSEYEEVIARIRAEVRYSFDWTSWLGN